MCEESKNHSKGVVDEERLLEVYKKYEDGVKRARERYVGSREDRLKYAKERATKIVESRKKEVCDTIKEMNKEELVSVLLSICEKHSQMVSEHVYEKVRIKITSD